MNQEDDMYEVPGGSHRPIYILIVRVISKAQLRNADQEINNLIISWHFMASHALLWGTTCRNENGKRYLKFFFTIKGIIKEKVGKRKRDQRKFDTKEFNVPPFFSSSDHHFLTPPHEVTFVLHNVNAHHPRKRELKRKK